MTRFSTPIAQQIWDMKYRFKNLNDDPIDITVEDTWNRIATALAEAEIPANRDEWKRKFRAALDDWKFTPAGRIVAGAGTGRAVTLFNCFVMGTIPDSMDGIFSMLKEAALTMQQGGGIGYDFSPIRPSTSRVKKLGADASGPLSFMDCWDAMCRTVMSAGSRRGAMMATMRCDHPDIGEFIEAKRDSAKLRMFNLSVLATDAFMEAVDENESWPLVHSEPPVIPFDDNGQSHRTFPDPSNPGQFLYVHDIVNARDLWNQIMQATYDVAEPGVIFIDRINASNNLNYVEQIASTNPCGEQPLPPYGACLLGSINLAKMVLNAFQQGACIDEVALRQTVRTAVRMMDNVVDVSNFPLDAQREEAKSKRRIGLGVTGLADALIMMGITYGTEGAATETEEILKIIALESYWASVDLAKEKGAFPLFDPKQYPGEGTHVEMLCKEDPELGEAIAEHGIRNALLTSIAPTGTISMYSGNVSSGIEPVFAMGYNRRVLKPDGTHMVERVEDYAVAAYREHWESHVADWIDDGDVAKLAEPFDPARHLPDYFVTAQILAPEDHVRMQAAAQKWVDSSISKTVNLPEDISFEDFQKVYEVAYASGCKGCTTYRPNDVTGSILSVNEKPKEDAQWADTAAFLVEVQNVHDANVAEMGQKARDHYFSVLEMFEVEMVADVPVEHRVSFLDYMVSTDAYAEGAGMTPEAEDHDDLSDLDEGMLVRARGYITTEEGSTAQAQSLARGFMPMSEELPERPDELTGSTYKLKVGDQSAVYLTINDSVESDGTARPFEIFLRSSDPVHDEWMVAMARTVSAVLRRPYDAAFLARELKQVHSHVTGGFMKGNKGYVPSLVAAIGIKLGEHMAALEEQNQQVLVSKTSNAGTTEQAMRKAFEKAMTENPAWTQGMGYSHPGTGPAPELEHADRDTLTILKVAVKGPMCSNCGSYNVKVENGCPTCLDCGHSKCG